MNLTGNPKLDRLNAAVERVMAEKAAARASVFDGPVSDGQTGDPDPLTEIA